MELQTISQVSKSLSVLTRMLRYYEQVGLIQSIRMAGNSYRMYDEASIRRLRQIIILRKLRVSVKQISEVLGSQTAASAIDVFEQNIHELNEEISALSTVQAILGAFVEQLQRDANVTLNLDLINDETMMSMIHSLLLSKNLIREEKTLDAFVKSSGLLDIKPDIRHFDFNNTVERLEVGVSSPGYEMWVSIPEDMEVPAPLVKRASHGGIYAAHAIRLGEFDHWIALQAWVNASDKYESDVESILCTPHMEGMDPGLEEHLNYFVDVQNPVFDPGTMQLDLLYPVKLAEAESEAQKKATELP